MAFLQIFLPSSRWGMFGPDVWACWKSQSLTNSLSGVQEDGVAFSLKTSSGIPPSLNIPFKMSWLTLDQSLLSWALVLHFSVTSGSSATFLHEGHWAAPLLCFHLKSFHPPWGVHFWHFNTLWFWDHTCAFNFWLLNDPKVSQNLHYFNMLGVLLFATFCSLSFRSPTPFLLLGGSATLISPATLISAEQKFALCKEHSQTIFLQLDYHLLNL